MPVRTRRVIVLGSTGSIGRQTLDVIAHLNALADRGESDGRFEVVGLAARSNVAMLREQRGRWPGARLAIAGANAPDAPSLEAWRGEDAPERLLRETPCDLVIAAMVGFAGLPATLAAIDLGRTVALANKETLVAAGEVITRLARARNVALLPIDSEHAGVWQALGPRGSSKGCTPPASCGEEVARVTITASGGPFRTWPRDRIAQATPEEALNHPTWSMGPKVTIDSASLMNKALELIEAHWLFGVEADRLGVLVHPQSLVHAIVQWRDGTMNAQLAPTDMRSPIQAALSYPRVVPAAGGWSAFDLAERRLDFELPDTARFPAVDLGARAIRGGGAAGTVLNAANEVAVRAFLDRRISFVKISDLAARAMEAIVCGASTLDDVMQADHEARAWAASAIAG